MQKEINSNVNIAKALQYLRCTDYLLQNGANFFYSINEENQKVLNIGLPSYMTTSNVNYVRITYIETCNAFFCEFFQVKGDSVSFLHSEDNVFFDRLFAVFVATTGLILQVG